LDRPTFFDDAVREIQHLDGVIPVLSRGLGGATCNLLIDRSGNALTWTPQYWTHLVHSRVLYSLPTDDAVPLGWSSSCPLPHSSHPGPSSSLLEGSHSFFNRTALQPADMSSHDPSVSLSQLERRTMPARWDQQLRTGIDKTLYCAVAIGRGAARSVDVTKYNDPFGAKFRTHCVSYAIFRGGFKTEQDGWDWISRYWPGVSSRELARALLWANTPLKATNFDITHFPVFHTPRISDPQNRVALTFTEDDDRELWALRAEVTPGHPTFNAARASRLFDMFGTPGEGHFSPHFRPEMAYETLVDPRISTIPSIVPPTPSRPLLNADGGIVAPPVAAPNNMEEDTDDEAAAQYSQLSLEDTTHHKRAGTKVTTDSPKRFKSTSGDATVDTAADSDDETHLSEDLLATPTNDGDKAGDTDDRNLPPIHDSQEERWGLVCATPCFTAVYDIHCLLTPFYEGQDYPSIIHSVNPVRFTSEDFTCEWGMLIEADPSVIRDLDVKLADVLAFHRSMPTHTLRDADWSNVQLREINSRAEHLAHSRHVKLLKLKCPEEMDEELLHTLCNSTLDFREVYDRFVGSMRERGLGEYDWLSARRPTSKPATPVHVFP